MKRLVCALIIITFSTIICSCSVVSKVNNLIVGDGESDEDSIEISTEDAEELINRGGTTAITMYFYGSQPEGFKDILKEVEKECVLDIQLDLRWYNGSEYTIKLRTALECGNIHAYRPSDRSFQKRVRSDCVVDISELLPSYAPNIYNQLKSNGLLEATKYDGKTLLLPSLFNEPKKILINMKDIYVEKYNINKIDTIEDYIKLLQVIKEDNEVDPVKLNTTTILNLFSNIYDYEIFSYWYGLVYKKDDMDMKLYAIELLPEFKRLASLLNGVYRSNIFTDSRVRRTEYPSTIYTSDRIISNYSPYPKREYYSEEVGSNYCTFALYPGKPLSKEFSVNSSIAFVGNEETTIKALKFLDWAHSSQEAYDLMNYGIKNKHYEIKDDDVTILQDFTIDNYLFRNNKYDRDNTAQKIIDRRNLENEPQSQLPLHDSIVYDSKKIPTYTRGALLDDYLFDPITSGTFNDMSLKKAQDILFKEGTRDIVVKKYQSVINRWNKTKSEELRH